jgi:lipopolysaccharide biosynthesis glycosyltransferase
MDLEQIRLEKLFDRIREIGQRLEMEPLFPEQDALNLACKGSWLELHPKWNAYASLYLGGDTGRYVRSSIALGEAFASPAVLHFESPILFRPWSVRCIHPHRELYRAYRDLTPWPLHMLEASGAKDRVMSRLPVSLQLTLSRIKRRTTTWR